MNKKQNEIEEEEQVGDENHSASEEDSCESSTDEEKDLYLTRVKTISGEFNLL